MTQALQQQPQRPQQLLKAGAGGGGCHTPPSGSAALQSCGCSHSSETASARRPAASQLVICAPLVLFPFQCVPLCCLFISSVFYRPSLHAFVHHLSMICAE